MMQSMIQYFKNSRVSELSLSECDVKLSCNQRQFALYFELEEKHVARSLWNEIHDDKIVASSLQNLNLCGLQLSINQRIMLVYQELSMLDCANMKVLDLSQKTITVNNSENSISHLCDILENLPTSLVASVVDLRLDKYLLYQNVSSMKSQDLKKILGCFINLERLSLSSSWFVPGTSGKEELIKITMDTLPCIEEICLENCHITKDVGLSLCRVIKSKAKRGIPVKIGTKGVTGDGLPKLVNMINPSKFLYSELNQDTEILTINKV